MQQQYVTLTYAEYRHHVIRNQRFKMLKPPRVQARGWVVTVINEGQLDGVSHGQPISPKIADPSAVIGENGPVQVDPVHISFGQVEPTVVDQPEPEPQVQETDEEAMERIAGRFNILNQMTAACADGHIRSMIVSGPPGVGKSFGIEHTLNEHMIQAALANQNFKYDVIKGTATPIGLYQLLYHHSAHGSVLVLDDIDTIMGDEAALNLLKGALDTGRRRRISWNAESRVLAENGVPDSFNFDGAVIFCTNLKLEHIRSVKIREHMEALVSRSHYLDLTIDSSRDKVLRIKQVHRDAGVTGGLFANYDFADGVDEEIFKFIEDNQSRLRELSIRTALKIADLVKVCPSSWRSLATVTVLKK